MTSLAAVFISSHVDWSVRQMRPQPTSTSSISQTSAAGASGAWSARAASRSSTDSPRGPEPTTAIRTGSLADSRSRSARTRSRSATPSVPAEGVRAARSWRSAVWFNIRRRPPEVTAVAGLPAAIRTGIRPAWAQ